MKISSQSLGFCDDVIQSIKFRADVAPLKRRKRQITTKEKVEVNVKHLLNPLDLIQKLNADNQSGMRIGGIEHLSNLKNADMNNLMKIDFAVRDWIDDTDSMIPRMGAEFPRISNQYKDKSLNNEKSTENIMASTKDIEKSNEILRTLTKYYEIM